MEHRIGSVTGGMIIAGTVLALLTGSAFVMSLNSFQSSTIMPTLDQTESAIEDIGGKETVTIGGNLEETYSSPEERMEIAEKQMEGLVVFNMLSASNCNVMSSLHVMSLQVDEDYKKDVYKKIQDSADIDLEDGKEPGELTEEQIQKLAEVDISPSKDDKPYWVELDPNGQDPKRKQDADINYYDRYGHYLITHELYKIDNGEYDYIHYFDKDDPWVVTGHPEGHDSRDDDEKVVYLRKTDSIETEEHTIVEGLNYDLLRDDFGYSGRFDSFGPLLSTDFDQECVGLPNLENEVETKVREIGKKITEEIEGEINEALPSKFETGVVLGAVGAGVGLAACPFTMGAGCVAAAGIGAGVAGGGGYLAVDDGIDIDIIVNDGITQQEGFDMEGRQGRMYFEINQSFTMGESVESGLASKNPRGTMEVLNDPLLALTLELGENDNEAPGFWRSGRLSYLVPDGLNMGGDETKSRYRIHPREFVIKNSFWDEGEDEDGNKKSVKYVYGLSDEETSKNWFYAFRPRMVNVPIISNTELSQDKLIPPSGQNLNEDPADVDWYSIGDARFEDINKLRNFLANTKYLFCDGASGYVQSNGGHMEDSTEQAVGRAEVGNQVYPKVEIASNPTECLPTSVDVGILDEVEEGQLDCSTHDRVVLEEGIPLFERETVEGETHSASAVCGGKKDTTDIGAYADNMPYYIIQPAVDGCEVRSYDITEDGGDKTLNRGDDGTEWLYETEELNEEEIVSGGGESEKVDFEYLQLAYKRSGVQAFEIGLTAEGESTKDMSILVLERDGTFQAALLDGNDDELNEVSLEDVSSIEGYNTVEIDSAAGEEVGEVAFNRPQDSQTGQSFSHESLNVDRFEEVSIKPVGADRIEDVTGWEVESDELSNPMEIRFVKGSGEPAVCRE